MTESSGRPSSASEAELVPGEVHLWLHRLEPGQGPDIGVLSEAEQERVARLPEEAREAAGRSRAFLRTVLSRYAEESPAEWRFEIGVHGKPHLIAPSRPLEFNLSHSGDWLACAVSADAAVGVDVQHCDPERRYMRLARRYFSESEMHSLQELGEGDQRSYFYRLWSLKEAWTKARGGALPTALGTVSYQLGADCGLFCSPPAGEIPGRQGLLALDPHYSLAFNCLQAGPEPRCFELQIGGGDRPLLLPLESFSSGHPERT